MQLDDAARRCEEAEVGPVLLRRAAKRGVPALVAALSVRERPRSDLGLPDHEFEIAVNADRKVGALRYAGHHGEESGACYAVGSESAPEPLMYGHAGNEVAFPADLELSLDIVRDAAKQFLATGGERPSTLEWRQWPSDLG